MTSSRLSGLDENVRLGDNTQEDFQTESMGPSLQQNLQRGYWLRYWHEGLRGGTALNPRSAGGQYYIGTTIETKMNPAPTSASVIGSHCSRDCLQHWPHHGKGGHFHFKWTQLRIQTPSEILQFCFN